MAGCWLAAWWPGLLPGLNYAIATCARPKLGFCHIPKMTGSENSWPSVRIKQVAIVALPSAMGTRIAHDCPHSQLTSREKPVEDEIKAETLPARVGEGELQMPGGGVNMWRGSVRDRGRLPPSPRQLSPCRRQTAPHLHQQKAASTIKTAKIKLKNFVLS